MDKFLNNEETLNALYEILESKKGHLDAKFTSARISLEIGVKSDILNRSLQEHFGITVKGLIAMYRIQHASMLLRRGAPFKELHRMSGFSSASKMLQTFDDIVK